MKITEVKTAFKICDVTWDGKGDKLEFKYLEDITDENGNKLDNSVLTENFARVYLIVVDGDIYKIGGSQAKGGMRKTLEIYQDGGVKGRPSIRSYGVYRFLLDTMKLGKKIEFYMIYQKNFAADVKGLFDTGKVDRGSINYKLIEERCLIDYKSRQEDSYPEWNLQEQGKDWPSDIKNEHAAIVNKSTNRGTKKGRKEAKGN